MTKINNYLNQGIKPFSNRYKNVMMFKNWNATDVNVVAIPCCRNEESFNSVNRNKNPFIDNLPCYITGSDDEMEVDEAVGWI